VLPRVTATAYLTPLREGGSLPGLVEADDDGTYVVKFTGAGQGPKALVAEIVVAELARRVGLRVPELAVIELDPELGRREPDEEVQDLLLASPGPNLAVDFLPGSMGFDWRTFRLGRDEASRVLWLDGLVGNVDRSARNPNLLVWHGDLWLIDHGASLWFHHAWVATGAFAASPYRWDDHVLQPFGDAREVHAELADRVDGAGVDAALDLVPEAWLEPDPRRPDPRGPADAAEARARYRDHLLTRLAQADRWLP
jgi:hypothetical protein